METHAWHVGNAKGQVQSVASKQANPWGLFDMYGNLWELTHEWLRDGKSIDTAEAKEGPAAGDRVNFLGGSFHDPGESTTGFGWAPAHQPHSHIGFRVAIVGDLKAKAPSKPPAN